VKYEKQDLHRSTEQTEATLLSGDERTKRDADQQDAAAERSSDESTYNRMNLQSESHRRE
jgi:hypothetical protein